MKMGKRIFATLLAVILILTGIPLQGVADAAKTGGNILGGFLDSLVASAADTPDYSNLTVNQYMAKVMLNHNYEGAALNHGSTIPQEQLSFYLDRNFPYRISTSRVLVDQLKASNSFMSGVTSWKLLTFDPSNMVEDSLDEKGYYTAIIYSILDVAMESSELLSVLNNEYSKTNISLYKSSLSLAEELNNADDLLISEMKNLKLADFSAEQQTVFLEKMAQQEAMGRFYKYTGKTVSAVTDVLKVCTTVDDVVQTLGTYTLLASVGEEIEAVLLEMKANCPTSNTAMLAALTEVCSVCASDFKAGIVSMVETGVQVFNYAFSQIVGDVWNACLQGVAGGFVGGMLIGQAIGKTITNFCFSTDKIIEQFFAMDALLALEDLMLSTVEALAQKFRENESEENADNFIQAVKMMFSVYSLDGEYAYDFVQIAKTGGIINQLFYQGNEIFVEDFRASIDSIQSSLNFQCEWLTGMEGYRWYYEEDAPSAYAEYFAPEKESNGSLPYIPPYEENVEPLRMEPFVENSSLFTYREESDGSLTLLTCFPLVSGKVEIPSSIADRPIRAIASGAFRDCTLLTEVVFGSFIYAN